MNESSKSNQVFRRARDGDRDALNQLLAQHRKRLRRMIQCRLDRRLWSRVSPSDIIQDAYLEAAERLAEYLQNPSMPFFLWLRTLAGQKLVDAHRRHLGAKARDAARDISIFGGALPQATSTMLAEKLLGKFTAPPQAAIRAEMKQRLEETLNNMDPLDREVLALRHFEQLSNREAAQVLGLSDSGASARHLRAAKRLKQMLSDVPGFVE